MVKKKILVFCDYYLPGYKCGGGMRTIANMVDRIGDRYEFFVVARNHDGPHDLSPYTNVDFKNWNKIGNAKVFYLSKNKLNFVTFRKFIKEVEPTAIYLNSMFGKPTRLILILKKLGFIKQKIILAPEGELSIGAISNKPIKKKTFLAANRISKLYDNIIWKVCSEMEKEEVELLKGIGGNIFIAPNMSPSIILPKYLQTDKPKKVVGELKLVFLSRFARKKNFKWFLENISQVTGKLEVDIIAPIEDEAYWQECLDVIATLPKNIKITHIGSIPYEQALEKLVYYHFFLLPTLGENFGHVFIEGLSAGCPIIASNRTPWLNLENKGIGWDLPLENPAIWLETINYCLNMEQDEYSKLSEQSRNYAVDWLSDSSHEKATEAVLKFAVENI
jgi:glycosyltransferase involved in cell wall biosynthesis